jgi:PAS domain S-box-containing protein
VPAVVNDIPSDPGFYMQAQAAARGLKACAAFPLSIRGRPRGVLVIYAEQPGYFSDEEVRVLTALAEHIAFGVESADTEAERRRLVHDLGERVKELTVLHGAARCLQADRPLDRALLGELVSLLPPGWQYPGDCVARIEWGEVTAQTPRWRSTPWTQSATFTGGGQAGRIDVAYLVAKPPAAEGPFLAEERALLQSLADMLCAHAERQQARAELTRSLRELSDANQRLSFHVSRMPLAYIVWSHDLVVAEWNPAAERIFGWPAAEAVGRHAFELMVPPEAQPVLERRIADLLAGDASARHFVGEGVRKDGCRVVCEWFNAPLLDAGGRVAGYLSMVHDVTERRQAEAERERYLVRAELARLRAEQASRAKDEFLATVSHELRTPLTPILTWANLLRKGKVSPERTAEALAGIEHGAKAQAQLINDLLDVSRIAAGEWRVTLHPVDLTTVVYRVHELMQPEADAKGVTLAVALPTDAMMVRGDAERLQQILWNLVSNAVKFTPAGGRVDVSVTRVDTVVRLVVRDTGEGIVPTFLPHVFERFRQADASSTRRHGGLGLGLSIVRALVELHEGTVRADSPGRGHGATFTVDLPVAAGATVARSAEDRRVDAHAALGCLHVLVVDDDPRSNVAVSALLMAFGAEVRTAVSTEDALAIAGGWPPDVVVSDIAMPGADGVALLRALRAQGGALAGVPAIALTAYAGPADRVRLLAAGFHAHVAKPFDPATLTAAVEDAVSARATPH